MGWRVGEYDGTESRAVNIRTAGSFHRLGQRDVSASSLHAEYAPSQVPNPALWSTPPRETSFNSLQLELTPA